MYFFFCIVAPPTTPILELYYFWLDHVFREVRAFDFQESLLLCYATYTRAAESLCARPRERTGRVIEPSFAFFLFLPVLGFGLPSLWLWLDLMVLLSIKNYEGNKTESSRTQPIFIRHVIAFYTATPELRVKLQSFIEKRIKKKRKKKSWTIQFFLIDKNIASMQFKDRKRGFC